MTADELQRLRNWADAKIATGAEPAWAWYQYMKLREALDAVIGRLECDAIQMEAPFPDAPQIEARPRLIVCNTQPQPEARLARAPSDSRGGRQT